MTKQEAMDLCVQAKGGDEEAQLILLDASKSNIKHYARKYWIAGSDIEDLEQDLAIVLIRQIIPSYDGTTSWTSWCNFVFNRNMISRLINSRKKNARPLNDATSIEILPVRFGNVDEDGHGNSSEVLEDHGQPHVERIELRHEHKKLLRLLVPHLTDMEAVVLQLYLSDKTYKEMVSVATAMTGRAHNQKGIDNTLERIRRKAREIGEQIDWKR
jgi:RNA polymerase sigma factor (sigma-70 family)